MHLTEIIEDVHAESGEKKCDCKNCEHCKQSEKLTNMKKWRYTLITTVIFLVVVNPLTYTFVNNTLGKLVGMKFATRSGCPTVSGMLLHAVVFTLLLRWVMDITK